jgi:NADH:ubiquinone oxidoreductase subunit 4 (subunit M)
MMASKYKQARFKAMNRKETATLAVIVAMGFYPKPVLDLINPTAEKVVVTAGFSDPAAKVGK